MKKVVSYIAIIGTAAFVGNQLVIGFGFGSYWQSLDPIVFMREFGLHFPLLVPPTMGILLPTLIATGLMVSFTKGQAVVRKNWIIALVSLLITCTITGIYHLPTNFGFMDGQYSAELATSKLNLWLGLHWLRTIFVLIAAIFSVKAFQLLKD